MAYPGVTKALEQVGYRNLLLSLGVWSDSTARWVSRAYIPEHPCDTMVDFVEFLVRRGYKVILDSGLFTYMFRLPPDRRNDGALIQRLFDSYIERIRKLSHLPITFVEFDAQCLVGLDRVRLYRERLREILPMNRIMFVWHRADGREALCELAKYASLVGISLVRDIGFVGDLVPSGVSAARYLRSLGVRVHILGSSCVKRLLPFNGLIHSFDSTDYSNLARYGPRVPKEALVFHRGSIPDKHAYGTLITLQRLSDAGIIRIGEEI